MERVTTVPNPNRMHDIRVSRRAHKPQSWGKAWAPKVLPRSAGIDARDPDLGGGLPFHVSVPRTGLPRRDGLAPCTCGKTVVQRLNNTWRCIRCGIERTLVEPGV